ncbi:hypothetical protein K227x_24450 [Rubripirellula lacrimiformis]|uniref:Uncharacterized protein n=2 Tax=Rubripirellula lacrimiformis TaxID=1930273 RepID=A0A517NA96_9BACT|nr:hypothetical protein K227x_24450 [Rubripirellula lacrimiformis]
MAIHEHDREDLIREGKNMPIRGEVLVDGSPIVIGFRQMGQVSLYCGVAPVFQFNQQHQLRRVFWQDRRFAAQHGRLVELVRPNRGGRVSMVHQDLDDETITDILRSLSQWVAKTQRIADDSTANWRTEGATAQVFRQQLLRWLAGLPPTVVIAANANA